MLIDNEYIDKKSAQLNGDYCNEEHKNCDKCITDEEEFDRNETLFTRLPNFDGTVDLYMDKKMFDKAVEPFCRRI